MIGLYLSDFSGFFKRTEQPWETTLFYPENILKKVDTERLLNIFFELHIDSLCYNFNAYCISEYETLEILGLMK